MRNLLLAGTLLAAVGASPAHARLQIAITEGASTFTCFDGQLTCDQSGGANNLLLVNTTVGGAFVQIALTQSLFTGPSELQLSASSIENLTAVPITIGLIASDTDYAGPVKAINNSASLTFNSNVGASDSTLSFFADKTNIQGANPTNTPGTLLESVAGHAVTDPDSFSGSLISPFASLGLFSMTESASLVLRSEGSITGFNQSMETVPVPEPKTWALLGVGFGLMALLGVKRSRKDRLATV